jgi:FtsH-binding integral membrane protein
MKGQRTMARTSNDYFKEIKEARMNAIDGIQLDARTYNLVIGGITLYGLLLNLLMCKFLGDFAMSINPIVLIIGYFVSCFAGVAIAVKSDSALISFIGYNLVVVPVGLVLSISMYSYKQVSPELIPQAIGITAIIVAMMVALSVAFPNFFSKLGAVLFSTLLALIIVEVVTLILGIDSIIFAYIGAVIFSLYIGYDYWKAQQYPMTLDNAVDSALDIYLDIINLLLRVLRILSKKK